MTGEAPSATPRAARVLLTIAGIAFLVAAFAANQSVLRGLAGATAMEHVSLDDVRAAQRLLGLVGLALIGAALAVSRVPRVAAWFARPLVVRLLLSALVLCGPLLIAEIALRPVAAVDPSFRTNVFMADDALGWRLRPGATGQWMGIEVTVNGKGLRGPEVEYAKPAGTRRVLYLGDSVTFGFGIQNPGDVFPYLTGDRLRDMGAGAIETVNAGVGGYSPWQEHAYLAAEGFRYDPDLVVVCFVLNDVTEKFELERFGGTGVGFQLAHSTAHPRLWEMWRTSGVGWGTRTLAARLRFGSDVRAGASLEERKRTRVLVTDAGSPAVEEAWELTLAALDRIVTDCRERETPLAFVVLPYAWQLESPGASDAPQQRVTTFAEQRDVPVLDLLPTLSQAEGAQAMSCFIDDNHLSPRGHAVAAEALAAFLLAGDFLR